jgi:hypothetical protein
VVRLGTGDVAHQQVMFYNIGVQLYQQGDLEHANQAFDLSVNLYKRGQRMTYLQRLVYPKPNAEIAALASFQKAKVMIRAQQLPAAVDAMKLSLMINPGDGYSGIALDDAQRLHEQAMVVKYDLELLFKNNESLAKAQGKGEPKKGDGDGPPGDKPVPGTDPSTKPGKGNRDDI